jgi:predicted AAA+ superfamily ATPase
MTNNEHPLAALVRSAVAQLKELPDMVERLSYVGYISEFRYVALGVPRRAGKTTLIDQLAGNRSALVLSDIKGNNRYSSLEEIFRSTRGVKLPRNIKYECILIDESTKVDVVELLAYLYTHGLVSDSLFIDRKSVV